VIDNAGRQVAWCFSYQWLHNSTQSGNNGKIVMPWSTASARALPAWIAPRPRQLAHRDRQRRCIVESWRVVEDPRCQLALV